MPTLWSNPVRDPPRGSSLPSNDEIVAALTRRLNAARAAQNRDFLSTHHSDGGPWTGFAYPFVANLIAWVKHASSLGEADMQIFACEQLLAIPPDTQGKIRVPEVYRVIEHDDFVNIIMEYVHGRTLGALWRGSGKNMELREQLVAQVTNAISLFINNFHIPPNAKPGPREGCRISHVLFKNQVAPIAYDSVKHLEEHIP